MSTSSRADVAVRHTLRQKVFGWDMFISYRTRNRQYAERLRDALRGRGFDLFLDNFSLSAGTNVDGYRDGARRSRLLIVVGTSDVFKSTHVPREIEAYCSRGRRLRLVAISVEKALAQFESPVCPPEFEATPWRELCGRVQEDERQSAIDDGQPSQSVVDRVARSFDILRAETRLVAMTIVVGLLLVSSSLFAYLFLRSMQADLESTKTVLSSVKTDLLSTRSRAREVAEQLGAAKNRVIAEETRASDLYRANEQLSRANEDIERRGRLAAARLAVNEALNFDPVLAYRLAEYTYELGRHDAESSYLLKAAASRATLPYQQIVAGCRIVHVNHPLALLSCGAEGNESYAVLDSAAGNLISRIGRKGAQSLGAWIAVEGQDWRVLFASREYRTGPVQYPATTIEIRKPDGSLEKSVPVESSGGTSRIRMCGSRRLIVNEEPVPQQAISLLDAFSGQTTIVATSIGWGVLGRAIFCRSDGVFLVAAGSDFELFDSSNRGTRGRAALDDSRRGAIGDSDDGTWSPDGRALAIWARREGGGVLSLLVLEPSPPTLTAVTPLRSIDTAYTWMQGSRLVAATHSIDKTDFAIVVIDPAAPRNRVPVGHPPTAVLALAALPQDLLVMLEQSSRVSVRWLNEEGSGWSGLHPSGQRMYLSGNTLLSESSSDVRLWHLPPLASNWFFRSDEHRRYLRCAVGDPRFRWLAAGFATDQGFGIHMRSVNGGEERTYQAGSHVKGCNTLAFSSNGEWLVALGRGGISLFNTKTDARADFALGGNDAPWTAYVGSSGMLISDGVDRRMLDLSSADGPRLIDRDRFTPAAAKGEGTGGCLGLFATPEQLRRLFEGWRTLSAETPADTTLRGCLGSGWVERLILRNNGMTDIEFVPTDMRRLPALINAATFPPGHLRAYVERRIGRSAPK